MMYIKLMSETNGSSPHERIINKPEHRFTPDEWGEFRKLNYDTVNLDGENIEELLRKYRGLMLNSLDPNNPRYERNLKMAGHRTQVAIPDDLRKAIIEGNVARQGADSAAVQKEIEKINGWLKKKGAPGHAIIGSSADYVKLYFDILMRRGEFIIPPDHSVITTDIVGELEEGVGVVVARHRNRGDVHVGFCSNPPDHLGGACIIPLIVPDSFPRYEQKAGPHNHTPLH